MTATQIIEEIRRLEPEEQLDVEGEMGSRLTFNISIRPISADELTRRAKGEGERPKGRTSNVELESGEERRKAAEANRAGMEIDLATPTG